MCSPFRVRLMKPIFWIVPFLFVCFGLTGCGGNGTHHVSGKVVFNGKPVPAGKIYFTPDGTKGNSGPTGYANIKDGMYDTSEEGGMGCGSGPMIVAIEGVDPISPGDETDDEESDDVTAKTLFANYETSLEITGTMTHDFDVPAEAAKNPQKGEQGFIQP